MSYACDCCIARAWLLSRLGGHLERARTRIEETLALSDEDLIAAVGGRNQEQVRSELRGADPETARRRTRSAGLELICRCDPRYPARLRDLASPPAVLHVAGGLERFLELIEKDPVAIVGARKGSSYGLEVARALGRDLGRAGLTVLSGMALGIDSAAHSGALAADAPTVSVLPGPSDRPYPSGRAPLHRRIIATGAAISELPPGASVWRWTFPARNRVIAGIAAMTVVVEAGGRSGALLTAAYAQAIGRPVGAVPGLVTSPHAAGSNRLLARGAKLVTGAQEVLDHLFGAGVRKAVSEERSPLEPDQQRLLAAIGDGHDTPAALARAGFPAEEGLARLATLELAGYVRRGPGGRFTVVP